MKMVWHTSAELNILQATVHNILKVKLHEHAYKIQVVQMFQEDYHERMNFYQQMRLIIKESHEFLEELTFSDETTFHFSGKVSCHI
jgi:hypothetical protein